MQSFYEHGMNESLADTISEEEATKLCTHYIKVKLESGEQVGYRAWQVRAAPTHCQGWVSFAAACLN
jgi:hypothetical protein